ncbi:DUF5682 family protein [Alienimonas californiensis]|uniref:Uncharacterized protein n=1 Tax=Alienimonas californiensis TaxID=2527989 RepID=A0A517P649_9PLAN|nr:DUF5682 family protein [Alienimonas californiensis]QDT14861.1 hypothetical protein CA12_09410 [Alienimonas californiensis]
MNDAPAPVKLFGVRHHGPGCARALGAALHEYQPDAVLIEGPPEANDLIPLLADPAFIPPAAILVHPADDPSKAAFFPLAEYSPELTAARWALSHNAEVEFIDLPMTHQFGLEEADTPEGDVLPGEDEDLPEDAPPNGDGEAGEPRERSQPHPIRADPLGWLARAAGYDDRERWWEQQVEQRQNAAGLFDAIAEAMTELRTAAEVEIAAVGDGPDESRDALREAHMRRRLRAAVKAGRHKIAVVCGAWHVPALADLGPDKPDRELLKGLPKVKTAATLCPWTNDRLTHASGYGAGIESPGWYGHLWQNVNQPAIGWVTRAARLLREEGQDASSAGVIEAVRLADALAALRGFCAPGLSELSQAILGVLCHGEPAPLALIRCKLEVGDALGSVPPDAPAVPLQKDLEATQKRLRFKPTGEKKPITLDLRKETDLERSRLLHRLTILGVPWGVRGYESGTGTYKEAWTLDWRPEFAVRVIEANRYGGTVPAAASSKLTEHAGGNDGLADLVKRLDAALLADLPGAVGLLVGRVRDAAAVAADAAGLAAAIPPLARVARYGDVRGTGAQELLPVLRGMLERYFVGLPPACRSLDDEAAAAALAGAEGVHTALKTLELTEEAETWRGVLFALTNTEEVHGLLRGWAARTLLEERAIDADELARRARLALAAASEPAAAAAWVEGLLKGSAKVLLYEDAVWAALDGWLGTLDDERFLEVLPLLRRSFAHFSHPERREMGARVKNLAGGGASGARSKSLAAGPAVDEERARRVIPVLKLILGAA